MKLLIIGGTSFLGRATAEEAMRRGIDVTTFNRGRSGPDVPGVEALRGDRERDEDLARLTGRSFDGVVDTCGFVPRVVGRSAAVLTDSGAHYVYVSSISGGASWPGNRALDGDAGWPCASDAGPDDGDYGVLKSGCERAVVEEFGDRSTIVRAGLILGPHENVGRLTWWLRRMDRGGEVLAPGDPDRPMQVIDARDIATFMLDSIDTRTSGTYNVTGPAGNTTMGRWLTDAAAAVGSEPQLTWVDDDFLLERKVEPWTDLPLWMPSGEGGDHAWDVQTTAAERAGLTTRPVAETVRDTWTWMAAGDVRSDAPGGRFKNNGIAPDRERELLDAWHAR